MSKSARPTASCTSSWYKDRDMDNDDFMLECKAAYLTIMDDLSENIRSRTELQMALQQTGRNPSQKVLEKYWLSETDKISFDDFCVICRKEKVTSEEDLMKAFQRIDVNGDGFITFEELVKTMTQRGEKMSDEEVRRLMSEVDDNKDGKLNYKEFSKLIISTTQEVKKLARQKLEKLEAVNATKSHRERSSQSHVDILQYGENDEEEPHNRSDGDINGDEIGAHNATNGTASPPVSENPKPKPRPRSATRGNIPESDSPKPQPRPRRDERPKSPVAARKVRVPEPRTLREWRCLTMKGVLHADEDGTLISHKYRLTLTENTDVWITVQARPLHPDSDSAKAPLDLCLLVLNESTEKVVTLTEQRDCKGKYCVRCDLRKGRYVLLPFSTGCRLRKRKSDPKSVSKLVKKDGDRYALTRAFREALLEIFEMVDLDGNGLLSREEFNLYNVRTSGEPVQDEEWEVVEENIELKNGEITMKGFVQLNEMEAEDNEGDTSDLWVTLHSMGYNKALAVDESCPFTVNVYVEEDDKSLLEPFGFTPHKQLESAITHIITNKGDAVKINKDVTLYVHSTDYMTAYVAENKSKNKQTVQLDLSKSSNCVSSQDSLEPKLSMAPKSFSVPVFVMPQNERVEWTVRYIETLL